MPIIKHLSNLHLQAQHKTYNLPLSPNIYRNLYYQEVMNLEEKLTVYNV